jgi:16S rRNA (cytosine967-C5)-methyltransferase
MRPRQQGQQDRVAMTDARDIAYELTRRVNSSGGYLNLLLRYRLDESDLDRRDRALVTELTYGIQRHRNKLDYIISSFSRRPLQRLQPEVLDMLRMGVYQLSMMRIPQHAAVNETVEASKRLLNRGAASFINAVLRRTAEGIDDLAWPSKEDFVDYLEIMHSHPRWLVEYIIEDMGGEEAEEVCIADNSIPTLTLRVNTAMMTRDDLMAEVVNLGGEAQPSPYLQESLIEVVLPHETIMDLLEKGCCVVQDESSMLVSHALDPSPGSTVVDACAAPGGKSTHLALLGGENSKIIALDKNPKRLKALARVVSRQRLDNIEIKEGDAARLGDILDEEMDAVLVDAPCSGLGTLQRNPELKWRRRLDELSSLAESQLELLDGCAETLRPGGILVYSVCTFTREETTSVLDRFTSKHSDFRLVELASHLPEPFSIEAGSSGYIQLIPHIHSMEGMYIARLTKNG